MIKVFFVPYIIELDFDGENLLRKQENNQYGGWK